jgi:hypothetical protein
MTTQEYTTPPTGEAETPSDLSIADTAYLPEVPTRSASIDDYDPFDVDREDVDDK